MDMGVLKQFLRDEALSTQMFNTFGDSSPGKRPKSTSSNTAGTPSNEDKVRPLTSHRIIMDIIVK